MGIFGKKVTSENAKEKAEKKLGSTDALDLSAKKEADVYGDKYVADVYVDVKDDHNVTMTFQTGDKTAFDKKNAIYNVGGDVLPPGTAEIVGKKTMSFLNDLGATSLSFQKTGLLKGEVEEPAAKSIKGGTVYQFRLTAKELASAFTYINDKRKHSYTAGYNSATFASHALKAAGIDVGIKGGSSKAFTDAMDETIAKEGKQKWTRYGLKTKKSVFGESTPSAITDRNEVKYSTKQVSFMDKKGGKLAHGADAVVGSGDMGYNTKHNNVEVKGTTLYQLYDNLLHADEIRATIKNDQDNAINAQKAEIAKREADDKLVKERQAISHIHEEVLKNLAKSFENNNDDASADALLKQLDIYYPNGVLDPSTCMHDQIVSIYCGYELQGMIHETSLRKDIRDKAKVLLNIIDPDKTTEASYQERLNRNRKIKENNLSALHVYENNYIKGRATGSVKGVSDFLKELSSFIVNGKCTPSSHLDINSLKVFAPTLQELAFTKNKSITDGYHQSALNLLSVIAPEMNDETAYLNNSIDGLELPQNATKQDIDALNKQKEVFMHEHRLAALKAYKYDITLRAASNVRCEEDAKGMIELIDKNTDLKQSELQEYRGILSKIAEDANIEVTDETRKNAKSLLNKRLKA
jgi:hypothetical protein